MQKWKDVFMHQRLFSLTETNLKTEWLVSNTHAHTASNGFLKWLQILMFPLFTAYMPHSPLL